MVEIDGQQHTYPDHIERDNRKDEYINSIGLQVFRIKWINPINNKNKERLYQQINELKRIIGV